ncbi:MAG TPA: carbonic anhydrase [Syntrophomonadaceae bacterium]|nr:carbonic anhydrase [Syntrophomonadaceae bacterium]
MKRPALPFVFLIMLSLALLVPGCMTKKPVSTPVASDKTANVVKPAVYQRPDTLTAQQAQQLLIDGNKRFLSGAILPKNLTQERRSELVKGQKPLAVILACSDSRVPPELIFDQGLGDLFVVRVAGNVIDPITLGSIEYGVEHLGATLIVVLGHSSCGAVKASVDGGEAKGSIASIVAKIKPLVEKSKASGVKGEALYQKVEDENIASSVAELEKSAEIKSLLKANKVKVISGKYHLDTGEVVFFPEKK